MWQSSLCTQVNNPQCRIYTRSECTCSEYSQCALAVLALCTRSNRIVHSQYSHCALAVSALCTGSTRLTIQIHSVLRRLPRHRFRGFGAAHPPLVNTHCGQSNDNLSPLVSICTTTTPASASTNICPIVAPASGSLDRITTPARNRQRKSAPAISTDLAATSSQLARTSFLSSFLKLAALSGETNTTLNLHNQEPAFTALLTLKHAFTTGSHTGPALRQHRHWHALWRFRVNKR